MSKLRYQPEIGSQRKLLVEKDSGGRSYCSMDWVRFKPVLGELLRIKHLLPSHLELGVRQTRLAPC